MKRRQLLSTALVLATFRMPVLAQSRTAVPRIGLLWVDSGNESVALAALRDGLRMQGLVDGNNIRIETQSLVDRYERLADAADRLVSQKVDLIVCYGATATLAASKATSAIPIVMVTGGDPVQLGVVATLANPGGNVTGVTFLNRELVGKRLELLQQAVRGIRRVGVLLNPASAAEMDEMGRWETAAQTLGLETQRIEIRTPGEIEPVVAKIPLLRVDALGLLSSTMLIANRKQIIAAIARIRLPAIYGSADDVDGGGLISYGPNVSDGFRRAAIYVGKILKGARPANLAFEQATKFELAINIRTANALGIVIPQSILVRADKIVE